MAARFPEDDIESITESSEDEMDMNRAQSLMDEMDEMRDEMRTDPKATNYTTKKSSNPRCTVKQVITSLKQ